MPSWGNDMSVYVVPARQVDHGSQGKSRQSIFVKKAALHCMVMGLAVVLSDSLLPDPQCIEAAM